MAPFSFHGLVAFRLEKASPFFFNKLESPPTKDVLFQVRLKLALWFWKRSFFIKCCQRISAISLLSLLGKEVGPSFEQT